MKTLTVALPGREYEIAIQRGLLSQAGERIRAVLPRARRLAVVTDTNVGPLYYNKVKAGLERAGFEPGLFSLPAGEKSKNAAQLSQLWEGFMDFGLTRTDGVVALGGGVAGDLAGFAAATILRGVAFVQIPTTLLAQVDSSVGGKVAVDLEHGKNLAGAFYQPRLVLMDPDALDTLPLPVFMDGMAEVVKYGCIRDAGFFEFLTARPSRPQLMADIEHILYICCDIKREVVTEDELDTGLRMILNFGHTLGHTIEQYYHYERESHGEAVAIGMYQITRLAEKQALTAVNTSGRILNLLKTYGLPFECGLPLHDLTDAVRVDKKNLNNRLNLILLHDIGTSCIHPASIEFFNQYGSEMV